MSNDTQGPLVLEPRWHAWNSLGCSRLAGWSPFYCTLMHPRTYCGVEQDEHHGIAQQTFEASVVLIAQHIVEVAGQDTHLVNDQLLWWAETETEREGKRGVKC